MSERALGKTPLRQRATEEFATFAGLAIYLYICFGAVLLFKSAVLREAGVNFTIWGIAAIKAMLLAKFMLVGRMLHIGQRFRDRPLIWPTLYHALMFLVVLLILTTAEELIVGFVQSRALGESLNHVVGPIFFQGLAVCLILFLILVPYSAFTCLGDVLGERAVFRLFFVDRSTSGSVGERLSSRLPPAQPPG